MFLIRMRDDIDHVGLLVIMNNFNVEIDEVVKDNQHYMVVKDCAGGIKDALEYCRLHMEMANFVSCPYCEALELNLCEHPVFV